MSQERVDVVVVGAGIAGGSLAAALARGGMSVRVLERSAEYVDHVRGEYMHPWGVAEAQRLGVHDALTGAGGNVIERFVGYDEAYAPEEAEAGAVPLGGLVPGVAGGMAIGHPTACRALEAASVDAGAHVVHGVEHVAVTAGAKPSVQYKVGSAEHDVACRLVVGADGRESAVRKQTGIELHRNDPRIFLAGLLVEGIRDWPLGDAFIGTEGDSMLYCFPQGEGRARLYLGFPAEDRTRLAGSEKAKAFLEAFRVDAIPDSARLADAAPAGPCAAYPMFDSWTDDPAVDGAVLVGDAAGFSDPTIGEGLSIALRDARMVSEAMLEDDDWSTTRFEEYAQERAERMRRLRFAAQVFTDAHIPLGPDHVAERRRRLELMNGSDPDLFMVLAAITCGPELAPESCFGDGVRDRMLAPA
jgi:2-polyprenyl-6-methoxyphenol hydroxylase-like FAD-dependent oxidoreductase